MRKRRGFGWRLLPCVLAVAFAVGCAEEQGERGRDQYGQQGQRQGEGEAVGDEAAGRHEPPQRGLTGRTAPVLSIVTPLYSSDVKVNAIWSVW